MRTTRSPRGIPAVTLALAMVVALVACGSDSDSADTTAATSATAVSAATTTAPVSEPAATDPTVTIATVAPEITVATVAPEITVATVAPETTVAMPGDVAISVTFGVDSGADRIETVPLGSTVTLTVVNPTRDDEFHVHGYELGDGIDVPAGEPEIFTFVADQPGQFEVESHTTEEVLLVLDVS